MKNIDILVVDDSESFREIIVEFLGCQSEINQIVTVGSGKEALEKLNHFIPDVVLMDIVMPEMNGFETSKLIREKFPKMPIIILSGNESTDSKDIITKMNLNGFVSKVNVASEILPIIFKSLRK